MKRGRLLILAVAIVVATVFVVLACLPPLYMPRVREYLPLALEMSEAYGVDVCLVLAVANVESAFDPHARSAAGAMGLMQLMPDTARWIAGVNGWDYAPDMLLDARYNVRSATWYLAYLSARFEREWALAAYNAGEGVVQRWQREGIAVDDVPYRETREYVAKVCKISNRYARRGVSG